MATFTQALSEARRKASLSGRPISQQEVQGITAGYAEVASERAARAKSLSLQEEELAQQKALEEARLAESKRQADLQAQLERESTASAEKAAHRQTMGTTTAAGAAIGAYAAAGTSVGGPVGAVIGAAAGLVAGAVGGGSHLCTEYTSVVNEIDYAHMQAFKRLRIFAREHFPVSFKYYLQHGPEIIRGVRAAHPEPGVYVEWWQQFHANIIQPILSAPEDDTGPLTAYIYHCRDILFPTYAPDYADGAEEAVWEDTKPDKEVPVPVSNKEVK